MINTANGGLTLDATEKATLGIIAGKYSDMEKQLAGIRGEGKDISLADAIKERYTKSGVQASPNKSTDEEETRKSINRFFGDLSEYV